ncbi:MAG: twin-arginine translocation signal domain-containing protein [Candidatus Korobacteraceae bacterium]|jgi:aminocarboxymuconate-semialdehyde decarboxylase
MNRRDFLVAGAVAGGVALTGSFAEAKKTKTPIIDTHAHWYPQAWVDMVAKDGAKYGAKVGKNNKGYVTFSTP